MSSNLEILVEMGFQRVEAQEALQVTGNRGPEAAMEWLLNHGDAINVNAALSRREAIASPSIAGSVDSSASVSTNVTSTDPSVPSKSASDQPESASDQPESASAQPESITVKSVKCDVCSKLFKSDLDVEFHAIKTGHQSYSESTEVIVPLTEEQKKEQMQILAEKIKQRRLEKEEEERREQIAREKSRRRTGQEVVETKKRMEEEEMRRNAEQQRREKAEAKLARQRVLEAIELDKKARKAKFSGEAASIDSTSASPHASASLAQAAHITTEPAPKREYLETRLQVRPFLIADFYKLCPTTRAMDMPEIRLTNGQTLTQSFGIKEELAAVRLYIEMNRTDGVGQFSLMTTFPKKVFSEDDMGKPLYELGLVPSAVLILSKVLASNTA